MKSTVMRAAVSAAGLLAVASSAPAPAAAAEAGQRCVVDLDSGRAACAADQQTARRLAGIGAQSLVVAVFYDHGHYTGTWMRWFRRAPCTRSYADIDSVLRNFDQTVYGRWSNRISSLKTFHRCDVRLYDGFNLTGARTGWLDSAYNLHYSPRGWNDRASSAELT